VEKSDYWLQKRAKKAGIHLVPYQGTYSLKELKALISKVYKKFCHLKQDDTLQDTWIAQLINAQSEAWNCSKKAFWKQMHCTEQIRKMANNVHHALHKMQTYSPLSTVKAPGTTSSTQLEYHQKVELEKACLEEAS